MYESSSVEGKDLLLFAVAEDNEIERFQFFVGYDLIGENKIKI